MIRMFVVHPVADYDAWKRAYDAFDEERRTMAVVDHAVFRSADDPNEVTVWHDFPNREAAEAFATSTRLQAVMEDAGVIGSPRIWFVDLA